MGIRFIYVVRVIESRTGKATTIRVEAESAEEAGRSAAAQGWRVDAVEIESVAPAPRETESSSGPPTAKDLGKITEQLDRVNNRLDRVLDGMPTGYSLYKAVFWGTLAAALVISVVSWIFAAILLGSMRQ